MTSSEREAALARVQESIRRCDHCGLCGAALRYVPGEGPADAEVVLVGEAPGAREDREGRPFVGPSGQVLTRLLALAGLPREEVFITSVVKCRPPGNREPTATELAACLPHLRDQLAVLQPRVICTLGRISAQALIDRRLSITREHGASRRIDGLLYVPLYHPAAALHQQQLRAVLEADMLTLRALLEEELGPRRRKEAG